MGNRLHPVVDDRRQKAVQGQGLVAETFPRQLAQGATILSDGVMQATAIGLARVDFVQNIAVQVSVNGASLTLAKAGLYSSAGVLLASSTDQKSLFTSGSTTRVVEVPMQSAYVVPTDGIYFAAILFVSGTIPTLVRGANLAASSVAVGSNPLPHYQQGSLSDLPSTSTPAATSLAVWFGVT